MVNYIKHLETPPKQTWYQKLWMILTNYSLHRTHLRIQKESESRIKLMKSLEFDGSIKINRTLESISILDIRSNKSYNYSINEIHLIDPLLKRIKERK